MNVKLMIFGVVLALSALWVGAWLCSIPSLAGSWAGLPVVVTGFICFIAGIMMFVTGTVG